MGVQRASPGSPRRAGRAPSRRDPRPPRRRPRGRSRSGSRHLLHAQALVAGVDLVVGAVEVDAEERHAPFGPPFSDVRSQPAYTIRPSGRIDGVAVVRQVVGQPAQRACRPSCRTTGSCSAAIPASFALAGVLAHEGDLNPGLDVRRRDRVDGRLVDRLAGARRAARDLPRLRRTLQPSSRRRTRGRTPPACPRRESTCRRTTPRGRRRCAKEAVSTRVLPAGEHEDEPAALAERARAQRAAAAGGSALAGTCATTSGARPVRAAGAFAGCVAPSAAPGAARSTGATRSAARASGTVTAAPRGRAARPRRRRSRRAGRCGRRRRRW